LHARPVFVIVLGSRAVALVIVGAPIVVAVVVVVVVAVMAAIGY